MSDPSPWSRREPEAIPAADESAGKERADPPVLDSELLAAEDEAETEAAAARDATPPPSPSRARRSGLSSRIVIPILGVMLVALAALVVGLVLFLTRDEKQEFPANRNEADYDLPAMALRNDDLPEGMELFGRVTFDNKEWADILESDDPEKRLAQLNASGRIRNHVSIFRWADDDTGTRHYGETISLIAQSTVFETVEDAQQSISGRGGSSLKPFCGLAINEQNEIQDFKVPRIADQALGFRVISLNEPLRISQEIVIPLGTGIETVVCFRTGNVVHGLIQNARKGAEDSELVIDLARRMAERTKNEYAGKPDPLDKPANDGG